MKTFYVTIASNQPKGSGYYEVHAIDELAAREATIRALGRKWSMLYASFDDVHELDRKLHGRIS